MQRNLGAMDGCCRYFCTASVGAQVPKARCLFACPPSAPSSIRGRHIYFQPVAIGVVISASAADPNPLLAQGGLWVMCSVEEQIWIQDSTLCQMGIACAHIPGCQPNPILPALCHVRYTAYGWPDGTRLGALGGSWQAEGRGSAARPVAPRSKLGGIETCFLSTWYGSAAGSCSWCWDEMPVGKRKRSSRDRCACGDDVPGSWADGATDLLAFFAVWNRGISSQ